MASVAKNIEISAQSAESFEAAAKAAVDRAAKTVKNIKSAWVKEEHLVIENNKVAAFRVHVTITFVLDEGAQV